MRDAQRARLYRAEQAIRSTDDVRFASTGEAQEWLDTVLRPAFADRLSPETKVTVRLGTNPKTSYACTERGDKFIDLSPDLGGWAWCGLVVAHEFAHHLIQHALPPHGADFARTFLATVRHYNETFAADLASSFTSNKVVFDPWHQWNVARDQVARLRSDAGITKDKPAGLVPVKILVYAEDPTDFVGTSYRWEYSTWLPGQGTYGDGIHIQQTYIEEPDTFVRWEQLRHVEGEMIRQR